MFGFSLQKILLLVAVLGAVWYGFKMVGRLQERQVERADRAKPRPAKAGRRRSSSKNEAEKAEEMVRCPVCDAFVAARVSSSCGRGDCPY